MKIYYLLFIILIINFASATDYFEQETSYTIKDTCTVNGVDCDLSFNCTFTVTFSNGTYLVNNSLTTKNGIYYTLFIPANLSIPDTYELTSYCYNGSAGGQYKRNYIVNQLGKEVSQIQGIVYIILLIVSGLSSYVIYLFARNMNYNDSFDKLGYISKVNYKKPLRIFFFMIAYLLSIWFLWLAYQISYALIPVEIGTTKIFYTLWIVLYYSLLPIIIIWFIVLVVSSIRALYKSARVTKGYMIR